MAKGITAKPRLGLGNDMRSFVDDISVTTHSQRAHIPRTQTLCIVRVSRDMAAQLAQGILGLRGKVSHKTTTVGSVFRQKLLLPKELRKLGIRTKVANAAKDQVQAAMVAIGALWWG